MGAVAPSSRALARAMTSIVPSVSRNEAILELGAGTGVITSRAWRGFAPAGFELLATRRVLKNFPPATILCFRKVDSCPPSA